MSEGSSGTIGFVIVLINAFNGKFKTRAPNAANQKSKRNNHHRTMNANVVESAWVSHV